MESGELEEYAFRLPCMQRIWRLELTPLNRAFVTLFKPLHNLSLSWLFSCLLSFSLPPLPALSNKKIFPWNFPQFCSSWKWKTSFHQRCRQRQKRKRKKKKTTLNSCCFTLKPLFPTASACLPALPHQSKPEPLPENAFAFMCENISIFSQRNAPRALENGKRCKKLA